MKNIIFLYLLLAGNMTYAQDAWRKIGDIAPESGFNSYPSIAIDSNNVPYVAYADLGLFGTGTDFGVTVKKFDGTNWQFVGPRAFSGTTEVASTEIAINQQNIPYVVYSMQPVGSNYALFKLDKYNGTGWDNLIQRTGVIGDRNALSIDRNNNPLFSYISNRNIFTMEINTLGPIAGFNNSLVGFYADFAVDKNNTIYIAYRGAGNSNLACVQRFNGATWEFVGPSTGISANRTSSTRIAIDHNNVPYIAYRDDIRETIDVQKFNGTNWELVGSAGFPGKAEMPDIAFDNNNVPYVSYNDFLNGLQTNPHYLGVSVQKFNGTAWVLVGQRTFSTINAISFGTQIVFGKNNVPYVTTNARVGSLLEGRGLLFWPAHVSPNHFAHHIIEF